MKLHQNQLQKKELLNKMIDPYFIESAKRIRKNFLKTDSDLTNYHIEIKNLLKFLDEKVKALKNIEDNEFRNKPSKEEVERVAKLIMDEIHSIEKEQRNLAKRVNILNDDILLIQKEEELLYKKIKERYPNYTDDQIREEIQDNLEE